MIVDSYAWQLMNRAVSEYAAYQQVADPDDTDNTEANFAGSLIGTLVSLIEEETGVNIHEEAEALT